MSQLLNTDSVLMCQHGGTVHVITSNYRVSAAGSALVRSSDTFTITGCTFSPGGPHPCVRVQWMSHAQRSKVSSVFTLNTSSVGMCLAADQSPQGTVIISTTQQRVKGQ